MFLVCYYVRVRQLKVVKRYGPAFFILSIILIGFITYFIYKNQSSKPLTTVLNPPEDGPIFKTNTAKTTVSDQDSQNSLQPSWNFDRETKNWVATINPPKCQDPLIVPSPVDVTKASGVLYPGQIRGGDYKPHGGFRFDTLSDNSVNVYTPLDATLVEASRHLATGEMQYVLYFINDCGIMYKLDHLRNLTPKFEKIIDEVPIGGENDSRTTRISPPAPIKSGELVATKVGIESTRNVFMDFGVYDLRKKNGVNYTGRSLYNIEQFGQHAICWLDSLPAKDKAIVDSLPGADGEQGKKSDYCF